MSAGLLVLAVSVSSFFISRWQETQLLDLVRQRLRGDAILVRKELGSKFLQMDGSELQNRVRKMAAYMDTRLTIVDQAGNVLADSEQEMLSDVNAMDNYLSRREFVQAARTGEGHSRRTSLRLGAPYLYYTVAIKRGLETVGFVRAAHELTAVEDQVTAAEKLTAYLGFGVTLIGLVVAYWLTTRLVSPINDLTEAAEGIAAGNYTRRIPINSRDELGALARSFERMSKELAYREAELRENVQRHTTVLSGMTEGVLAVDSQQHVLFANAAAGKKLRFNPDNVVGAPLLEVVRSHELRNLVNQCLENSKPVYGSVSWKSQNQVLALDVRATPLPSGAIPGVVLVLQDVSELKRLEGIRQQFVANVSHELKTPLSSIRAYAETLLNGAIEDKAHARNFLGRIDEQAARLNELILDLLSLARIESGQAVLDLTEVPLQQVVKRCLDFCEGRAKAKDIALVNEISDKQLAVRGDEESLQHILDNLIDNAVKYTPPGGTITISCSLQDGEARIEVVDTGVGIAAEHHDRLFERFYRVDKARSRELGGTGLGLSIVKHLCQAMGGSVSVSSTLGKGSTFSVRLPLAGNTMSVAP